MICFFTAATVASRYRTSWRRTGNHLSFILVALVCGFAALCYAELASMIPIAGSAYTYAYTTLGEIFAWIIGWDLILEYAVSNMSVAVGFSAYFNDICDFCSGVISGLAVESRHGGAAHNRGDFQSARLPGGHVF